MCELIIQIQEWQHDDSDDNDSEIINPDSQSWPMDEWKIEFNVAFIICLYIKV